MAPGTGFNPNAPPEMTVLADHPSRASDESPDYLGLESRLSAVFDIVRHKQTRCPITVAIYGDWGTGKTSAMRWLETRLHQWNATDVDKRGGHPRVHPVWFDPWRYQTREEVWRGIIAEVILSLFSVGNLKQENFPTRIREAARMFGSFLGRGFLHALANIEVSVGKKDVVEAKVSGEMFRDIFAEYEKAAQPAKAYLNQFEATLRQWVEKFLPKNKEGYTERLALFIDDLDRCLPAVTLEVLEALKLYLNIEPLVFVVGLDRTVVSDVVAKHYTDAGVDPGKSKKYLDKLFQIEIHIPPSEKQMEGYLDKQLEALDSSTGGYWHKTLANDEYRQALEEGIRRLARHNPREVKRLLSSSLLSGRAAADNPLLPKKADGEKARQLRFAQGVQFFLLQRFIQDRFLNATHVLLEKRSLHWFEELSEFIRNHPDFSLTPEFLSSERAKSEVKLGIFGISANISGHIPERAKSEGKSEEADWPQGLRELLDQRPADDNGKPLDLVILIDPKEPFLWPLLRVPFSAEVAQFAPKTEPQPALASAPPDTAKRAAEEDVRQQLSSTVLNRAARALDLPVDQLTSAHLLQLRELDLSASEAKNSELAGIVTLTSLQKLDLSGTKVTDDGLKELTKLTTLQRLNLTGTNVTNVGLKNLTQLTALENLDLRRTKVTDDGLKELTKLTTLQSLDLAATPVTNAGLKELTKLTALQSLDLSWTNVTDAGLKELTKLTALQNLSLAGTQVTDAGLKELAKLTALQNLYLGETQVTDAGLKELTKLTTLQSLNLADTKVTDAGLKELTKLTALQALILTGTRVTDDGLKELTKFTALQNLSLERSQVTDAGLKELTKLTTLQILNLEGSQVTDAGLKELTKLSALKFVFLTGTQVTDAGMKELSKLTALQFVFLTGTQVTDAGLQELTKLTTLRFVELTKTRVTESGVVEMRSKLPKAFISY